MLVLPHPRSVLLVWYSTCRQPDRSPDGCTVGPAHLGSALLSIREDFYTAVVRATSSTTRKQGTKRQTIPIT